MDSVIRELIQFVSIPNNVSVVEQVQQTAHALQAMLQRRGIATELWATPSGRPVLFGELPSPGATETLLVYSHYDGVPAEATTWHSDPYGPVLRTHMPAGPDGDWSTIALPADGQYDKRWRLFGRSVADSKNAIVSILAALDALRAAGQAPGVNLKFFFDGEEEMESPGLPSILAAHKDRLAADLLISASGERHQSGLPTVELGARGILMFDLTVYTSAVTAHSGHFGGFAPSAAYRLAHLLATFRDAEGRVTIPGFYDEVVPLSASEREAISRVPAVEERVMAQFGFARPEGSGASLQSLINLPTLNVRGITGGFVGEAARNIVPNSAMADFDVRLVQGMDPDRTLAVIRAHLERLGYTVLDREPTPEELRRLPLVVRLRKGAGFPATRTSLDNPMAAKVVAVVARALPEPPVVLPTEGGSIPMHLFTQLGMPFVGLPTSNFDCNQHTDDENLLLGCLFEAVAIFRSLFMW